MRSPAGPACKRLGAVHPCRLPRGRADGETGGGSSPHTRTLYPGLPVREHSHDARTTEPATRGRHRILRNAWWDPAVPVDPQEVVKALAVLIALDDRQTIERVAAELPPFLEQVDAIRASDGAMHLAQVLDRRRRLRSA